MNNTIFIPPHLRERAERYCDLMHRISGVDPLTESRLRVVVTARMMVAYALLQDGYSTTAVGIILGVDHATVIHYRRRMHEVLSVPGYEAEREIWEKFLKRTWSV